MRIFVFIAAIAVMTCPALAQNAASIKIATALGSVLASEELCGLSYDQAAISAYVEANVPADDMSFPSTLQMMTQGQEYQLGQMTASAKTAHCAQITRVAKSFDFIK